MTVKVFMLPCRNKIILYGAKPQTVCLQVSCTRTAQKCMSPKGSDCTFIITRKSLLRSLRPCRLPVQSFWGMLGRVFLCHHATPCRNTQHWRWWRCRFRRSHQPRAGSSFGVFFTLGWPSKAFRACRELMTLFYYATRNDGNVGVHWTNRGGADLHCGQNQCVNRRHRVHAGVRLVWMVYP